MSEHDRSSSRIRSVHSFLAILAASAAVSVWVTPTSAIRPGSVTCPTTSPSTVTDACDTRCTTARKIWDLRLLRDEQSASDVGAPVLVVSQFTLYGDARKGRRPTWQAAAPSPVSEPLYDAVCAELERFGAQVERGRFGADMRVESVNDGPITLVLDTPQ